MRDPMQVPRRGASRIEFFVRERSSVMLRSQSLVWVKALAGTHTAESSIPCVQSKRRTLVTPVTWQRVYSWVAS